MSTSLARMARSTVLICIASICALSTFACREVPKLPPAPPPNLDDSLGSPMHVCEPRDPTGACMACVIEHCCYAGYAWQCITDERCFDGHFNDCIVACFDERVDAEPSIDSWQIAAQCVDMCEARRDPAAIHSFPGRTNSGGDLVECIIGTEPDGYIDPDDIEEDSGVTPTASGRRDCDEVSVCRRKSPCVEACFPNWR